MSPKGGANYVPSVLRRGAQHGDGRRVLRPGIKKGPWTKTEDDVIKNCMDTGVTKWEEIEKRLVSRTGKQCRERYVNHLDPNIRTDPWTPVRSWNGYPWGWGCMCDGVYGWRVVRRVLCAVCCVPLSV